MAALVLSAVGENGTPPSTDCHMLEGVLEAALPQLFPASAQLPASFPGQSKALGQEFPLPPDQQQRDAFEGGWSLGEALALGPSSLLENLFRGSTPPPPWPKSCTLRFCDPMESQIKLVPIRRPWLSALSHFLAAHEGRSCQPCPSWWSCSSQSDRQRFLSRSQPCLP